MAEFWKEENLAIKSLLCQYYVRTIPTISGQTMMESLDKKVQIGSAAAAAPAAAAFGSIKQ